MRVLIGEYAYAFISGDPKACDLATSIARYPQLKLRVFSFNRLAQVNRKSKESERSNEDESSNWSPEPS
jgi:hypothetical protein